MKVDDIIWRLAQLASLPYQERYVVNGTVNEYVSAEELINNVADLKNIIYRSENLQITNDAQRTSLEDLFVFLKSCSDEKLFGNSREEFAILLHESKVWNEMRARAADVLKTFGLPDILTVEAINRLEDQPC